MQHQLGDASAAAATLELAERAARRTLGPAHQITMAAGHNLALALSASGRKAEAVVMLRAVLAARRLALGETHRDTLQAVCDLSVQLAAADSDRTAHVTEARALLVHTLGVAGSALGDSQ